jgi:TRAP-type C4-dicarboxylate transport system permease small subunit
MKFLDGINKFLNKVLLILGGLAVLALMLLATGNVGLRIFHLPFRGTYEIVSFLGAITIAFGLGYTQKRRDNIVVDILTERFPPGLQTAIAWFADVCIMVFFGIVAWQLYVWAGKLQEGREVSETLKVIYYPFVYATAVGFAVLSLTSLVQVLKRLLHEKEEEA